MEESWNVEGFTEEKGETAKSLMSSEGWHVVCMQEVWKHVSEYHVDEDGYLFVFSGLDKTGAAGQGNARAGVGFIVAPDAIKYMIGFTQVSARMAAIKFKIQGGSCAFVCAYAPDESHPYQERSDFYKDLRQLTSQISVHGPTYYFGDFNARLRQQLPHESDMIGPHVFPCTT